MPVDPVPLDREVALAAGRLRAVTLRHGLSLVDRICLCLAGKLELPAVTCDTMWRDLDIGIDIRVLQEPLAYVVSSS